MKKILSLFMSLLLIGYSFAADIDHFAIEISPNPVSVNEPADVTIKVVDSDGNLVKDYDKSIFMEVKGDDSKGVTLPGDDGMYKFESQDKGVKKFSKGLTFTTKGDYSFVVYEITNPDKPSEEKITVKDGQSSTLSGTITISSPLKGSTEQTASTKVVGNSTFPNSPVEIYLDEQKVKETTTDENGDFNDVLDNVGEGAHILKVKIVKIDGTSLAESDDVDYGIEIPENANESLFKRIEILPSNTVNFNDKIIVNVETLSGVSAAKIDLQGFGSFVMDKASDGKFTKSLVASKVGQFPISVSLTANAGEKSFPNVEKLTVLDQKIIKNVRYERSTQVDGDVNLSWEFSGTISKFKVAYGTGNKEEDLKTELTTTTPNVVLHNMNKVITYYAKVYPLNDAGTVDGTPSNIISISYGHGAAGQDLCMVKGIKITPKQEGDKYYLTWDAVPDTDGYIVYKSDSQTKDIKDMQKVAEVTGTSYEYPFDHTSKKDLYAYYAVEAKCKSGTNKQIDEVKKVKVGPMDNIMIMLLLSVMVYGGYKMYKYTKE